MNKRVWYIFRVLDFIKVYCSQTFVTICLYFRLLMYAHIVLLKFSVSCCLLCVKNIAFIDEVI